MSDDFTNLRTSLRESANGFRPELDASALARRGRARSRRRTIIAGWAGTLAVAVAALLAVPGLLAPPATVPAAPVRPSVAASGSAPTVAPIRPGNDATGNAGGTKFEAMQTPLVGAVKPDSSWKEVTLVPANLRLTYPPSWTVFDDERAVVWIQAPSGYSLSIIPDGTGSACTGVPSPNERQLGSIDLVATENNARGKGPLVIRWQNGGTFPVSINLAQRNPVGPCWQLYVNYGGVDNVYIGSADNTANPTAAELDEAVAILANATRIH